MNAHMNAHMNMTHTKDSAEMTHNTLTQEQDMTHNTNTNTHNTQSDVRRDLLRREAVVELPEALEAQLVRELLPLAHGNASRLMISRAGCFSCGYIFLGWGSIFNVDHHNSARCPSCECASIVTLNDLNEALSELLGERSFLDAHLFQRLLNLGAQAHYLRDASWTVVAEALRAGRRAQGLPITKIGRLIEIEERERLKALF